MEHFWCEHFISLGSYITTPLSWLGPKCSTRYRNYFICEWVFKFDITRFEKGRKIWPSWMLQQGHFYIRIAHRSYCLFFVFLLLSLYVYLLGLCNALHLSRLYVSFPILLCRKTRFVLYPVYFASQLRLWIERRGDLIVSAQASGSCDPGSLRYYRSACPPFCINGYRWIQCSNSRDNPAMD